MNLVNIIFIYLNFIIFYTQSRYCILLEEGIFRNRPADFVVMLLFGALLMIILSYFVPIFSKIKFLAHPLTFMMIYIWGRSPVNADVNLSFFGIFVFSAPYLPWAILGLSIFFGNPIETDLLGIVAGHIYYFFEFIYPAVANVRGWRLRRILYTPNVLKALFGQDRNDFAFEEIQVRKTLYNYT